MYQSFVVKCGVWEWNNKSDEWFVLEVGLFEYLLNAFWVFPRERKDCKNQPHDKTQKKRNYSAKVTTTFTIDLCVLQLLHLISPITSLNIHQDQMNVLAQLLKKKGG